MLLLGKKIKINKKVQPLKITAAPEPYFVKKHQLKNPLCTLLMTSQTNDYILLKPDKTCCGSLHILITSLSGSVGVSFFYSK